MIRYFVAFLAGGIAGAFLSAWSFELIFPTPAIQHWPRHDRFHWATSPAT
jgi:hypothetical protein